MSYRISEACNGCGACVKLCPVGAITGEKKNLHLIDSLLCIECGACGRICPTAAVKDSFGIVCERIKRSAWEKPQFDLKTCMPCGICIETCPVNCLAPAEPVSGRELHAYPFLKEDKRCVGCGFCASECPVNAIRMSPPSVLGNKDRRRKLLEKTNVLDIDGSKLPDPVTLIREDRDR